MKRYICLFICLALILSLSTSALAARKISGDYEYEIYGNEATLYYYHGNFETEAKIPSKLGGKPVTEIAWGAFGALWLLESVIIPDSVVTISDEAFLNCTGLTDAYIGKNARYINGNPFDGCTNLYVIRLSEKNQYLELNGPALYTKEPYTLISYPAQCMGTTYVIPEGVTGIGDSAFSGAARLKTVVIPSTVTDIHRTAFYDGYGKKMNLTLDVSNNPYAKQYAIDNGLKYVD